MDNVNITFITDDNYVMPTTIAIMSLVENVNVSNEYSIYLICDAVSDEKKKIFSDLETKNVSIHFIDVDSEKYSGTEKSYSRVSRAALLKFSIPDLLPDIDKVLYVDGDILLVGDIADIFNQVLDKEYAVVVKDGPKDTIEGGMEHAFYGEEGYFNSGVMLLNLKKLREDNMSAKLVDYRMHGYNYFMDQDTFNVVFNKNVKYMSVFNDFMLHLISYRNRGYSVEQLSVFYDLNGYETIDDLLSNVVLFHYTFDKPWKYYDIPLNEKWMEYYNKSAFCKESLNRRSFMTELYNARPFVFGRKVADITRIFRRK